MWFYVGHSAFMAKSKPKAKGGGKSGGGRAAKPDVKGGEAIRGMLLGALIIAVVSGFFMLPVRGKTTFDHLRSALGASDDKPEPSAQGQGDAKQPQGKRTRPEGVKIAAKMREAKPLHQTSPEDDAALDALVKRSTAQRTR